MIEFDYNNTKNANIDHTLFELSYKYYPRICFEDKTDLHSKSHFANKLADKFYKLIEIYYQNLLYT